MSRFAAVTVLAGALLSACAAIGTAENTSCVILEPGGERPEGMDPDVKPCGARQTAQWRETMGYLPKAKVGALEARARRGDAQAMLQLGHAASMRSLSETGAEKEAERWYRMAAEAGNVEGMWRLAFLYDGVAIGIVQGSKISNPTESIRWRRLAAEHGDALSMIAMGEASLNGWGTALDRAAAVAWLEKAAATKEAGRDAAFRLGLLYADGWGERPDFVKAVTWFRRAADAGDGQAMYNLGVLYEEGRGVPADSAEAQSWYRRAGEARFLEYECELRAAGCLSPEVRRERPERLAGYPLYRQGLSVVDEPTGIVVRLEMDGRHFSATAPDGTLLWRNDPFLASGLELYRTPWATVVSIRPSRIDPAPHHTIVPGSYVNVIYDSSQFGLIDPRTGKFTFLGQD